MTHNCALLRESTEFVKVVPEKAREIDEDAAAIVRDLKCEMKFPKDKEKQEHCKNVKGGLRKEN